MNICGKEFTETTICTCAIIYHPGNVGYQQICYGCGSCNYRGECYAHIWNCCRSNENSSGCATRYVNHIPKL